MDFSNLNIKRERRKTISLSILRDGTVSVKAPYLIPKGIIEAFVRSKSKWIEERQTFVKSKIKTPKKFENGEKFDYLGKEYILELGHFADIEFKEGKLLFPSALSSQGRAVLEKWYIREAKRIIKPLVEEYATKMDTTYNSITFSDTKSQWGRCTHDNRLQFNWRLVMAPLLIVRYVAIHELAHTTEKNHSARFWSIVRAANPSYRLQVKWLKENGHGLIV